MAQLDNKVQSFTAINKMEEERLFKIQTWYLKNLISHLAELFRDSDVNHIEQELELDSIKLSKAEAQTWPMIQTDAINLWVEF